MSVQNVTTLVQNDKLFITVDISRRAIDAAPNSKSGKNKLVGSTGGFVEVPGTDLRFGLNVID